MLHYQQNSGDFPEILHPQDLSNMSKAVVRALEQLNHQDQSIETEDVAKLVFKLYRRGLVDPEKLAAVAVLFVQSKLFRRS